MSNASFINALADPPSSDHPPCSGKYRISLSKRGSKTDWSNYVCRSVLLLSMLHQFGVLLLGGYLLKSVLMSNRCKEREIWAPWLGC